MLETLMTFAAVAEAGSFSGVAKAQGIAVSTITRRIELLEGELQARLFNRSSRRLTLTDAGQQFLPRALHILAEMADARDGLAALDGEPRGVLTVTAPAMFGRQHVAPAVISFLKQYPLLEVELHTGDEIVDLSEHRVDVAIRLGVLPDSDLVATSIAPVRRMLCASPDYLASAGRPEQVTDLLNHQCLTVASQRNPTGWWIFSGVNREQALSVHGSFRSDDTGALIQAAVAGLGIVHFASWLVSDAIAAGQLVEILPNAAQPARQAASVHAIHMPGRSHTAKVRLFVAHLRKAFGSPPYWERAIAEAS
ncbi:MAG: LysR family transcriptional regulator [Devosia sp.]|uniref:LysR family transcriptional regulator n=1 Tax=Devosia sp. TaxID=1871048 RepID=UPI002605CCC6|nr:LysR family transcriptional regulator [Devosia sp.]MDB5528431.1 LysR family transcriptional regulator [Devosia sp.]